MEKNYTDVVIDDKVYTIGCEQGNAYMQQLAVYINEKLSELRSQPGFNKQPYGSRQALILINMADDYMKTKLAAEETERKYREQENEFYNLKREMVELRLKMDQINLQNQVLSMGITGNDDAREKLMTEVLGSVRGKEGVPRVEIPSGHPAKSSGKKDKQ